VRKPEQSRLRRPSSPVLTFGRRLQRNKIIAFDVASPSFLGRRMRKKSSRIADPLVGKSSLPYKYIACLFITLILCIVDGAMTIFLVKKGAWEANPLMRRALGEGTAVFLFLKYFLTAGGLLFLLHHGRRRLFKGALSVEEVAAGIVLFYEGLVIYEISLYHVVK
jgi:hypothetical protein